MKKFFFTMLAINVSLLCFSQAYINGSYQVIPGQVANYTVLFNYPIQMGSSVSWNINGGTFSSITPFYEVVPPLEYIVNKPNNKASKPIKGTRKLIEPQKTIKGYNVTVKWGAGPIGSFGVYESYGTQAGSIYVAIGYLAGGSLSANINYFNAQNIPVVSNSPASGGTCNGAYTYTWEYAVGNNDWQFLGNGKNFPANPFNYTDNTSFRRKVQCGNEVAYSNTLSISYLSPFLEFNYNYVRINDIAIPGITTLPQAEILPTGNKIQSTTYLDGFGRPVQKVIRQASLKQATPPLDPNNINSYQDMVTHIEYDGLGRTAKEFLPYATTTNAGLFKTNAAVEQKSFTNTKYGEPLNNIYTYSATTFDGSPLNRVINVKLPGSKWNTDPTYKGISSDYDINKSIEKIRIWNIGYTAGSVPVTGENDIYADGKLFKNITKDEKDKLIVEYSDLSGNTILKKVQQKEGADIDMNGYKGWLCTYYVYDDFNRLRFTVTPKAVAQMDLANNWAITDVIKKGLCFYQEYDKKGRVIIKHSPDGGEVWLVYDGRDRLVLSQDENQRNRINQVPAKPNQWSFSLYDENDRPLATGLINDTRNRDAMQTMVDQLSVTPQNKPVEIYTGAWETITAYNPVAGKVAGNNAFYCQTCTASLTNTVSYYDEYVSSSKDYVVMVNNDFAPTTNPYVQTPLKSIRIKGTVTTSKIRVLNDKYDDDIITDDSFLNSTVYYDEKGRIIQTLADNIKGATDIIAIQYDFAGKVLSTLTKHGAAGSLFNDMLIVSKNEYDLLGRPTQLKKLFTKTNADIANITKYKKLSEVALDEFGRVRIKKIGADPSDVNKPLETMDYSYNIQGWLTGINKDYALANGDPGNPMTSQWSRRFGMYFGYENGDNKFLSPQWNGSITGTIWRSQGDNTPRKYDYEYDNINRFVAAKFLQKENILPNTPWASTKVDLSAFVTGYDENGNTNGMKHTGIQPGVTGGIVIDNLQYQYYDNSNKLKSVTDLAFNGDQSLNGKQGDFKDYAPANGIDYDYDLNGNLKYDKNKSIIANTANLGDINPEAGITHNFLDLPEQITIKGKSKTEFIYDAAGTKLAKKVTALINNPPPVKTTYYVNGFVYEENELQYILNEEGKLRIMEPVAAFNPPSNAVNYLQTQGNVWITGTKWGVWDYFIKDNLSNTRMVLTEETHLQQMKCSMEDANANIKLEEEQLFGQPAPANEVSNTRENTNATSWNENASLKISKLQNLPNGNGKPLSVGSNAFLKVMAGDQLTGTAKYYYQNKGVDPNNNDILNNIVMSFIGVMNSGTIAKPAIRGNSGILGDQYKGGNSPLKEFLDNQPQPQQNTTPKAYLNILFFDEQFNYVPESSSAAMIDETDPNTQKTGALLLNKTATKNGYAYLYVSNQSINTPVYFDDFTVTHQRSPMLEDNAYYPYGLKIDGISAKAALKPLNKFNYQGDYAEQDEETGYNEFALRNFDSQTGRWIQVDPYDEFASPYIGMGNDAVNSVDPDGGGINDWGKFINGQGHIKPIFDVSIVDQASAEAYALANGLTGAEYLFKAGSWTSNIDGLQDWNLFSDGTASKMGFPRFIDIPVPPVETVSTNVYNPSRAGKWDDFNQNPMAKTTDFGGLSNAIYGIADGIWTFSSMVKNGWRDARNMRGDNLISTYGGKGAESPDL
jgi:RHS repeat-associated protein